MADERVRQPVKITDPLTDANEAGVDASGNLQVILAVNTGVDIGDVDVTSVIPGTAATNLGKAENVASAGADVGVALFAVQDAVLAALGSVDGDYTWIRVDANGALWIAPLSTGTNSIGDIANIGTSVTPGTGATNLGKAEDTLHSTGDVGVMLLGVRNDVPTSLSGADLDYTPVMTDAFGRLQVDVITGGGSDTPTNPLKTAPTDPGNIAAGSTTDFDGVDQGGNTERLVGVDASASVPFKCDIKSVIDAVETIRVVLFGKAGDNIEWRAPHRDYFSQVFAANAGFDGYRVTLTNLDNSQAASMYAVIYSED